MKLITTTFALVVVLGGAAHAASLEVHRDLAYAAGGSARQTLDIYAPTEGRGHPMVIWIHGGGWRQGDKAAMQKKPQAFVERGCVFISINYGLFPEVTLKEMMGDVAQAIRWSRDHAAEYGGDPEAIVVMGHSAGAHLAALVCTDERYLHAAGVPLTAIKGCVPLDVSVYDVPKRLQDSGRVGAGNFLAIFGQTEEQQREASPVHFIAKEKNIPPFLILHVADRADAKAQSQWFAEKLQVAGVSATVLAAEGKTHGTINSELGLPEDVPTKALWKFLDRALGR